MYLRIEEILSLTENPKSKSVSIYLNDEDQEDKNKAKSIMYMIEYTKLQEDCFKYSNLF